MDFSLAALKHNSQFIQGMGYCDGRFRNTTKPLLWKYWTGEEKLLYQKSCMYGSYCQFRYDSKKLMDKYLDLWKVLFCVY